MTAMRNIQPGDTAVLINILLDTETDIEREGRSPLAEEKVNLAVINSLLYDNSIIINGKKAFYHEIKLSELKKIRGNIINCANAFISKINELIKLTLKDDLKNADSYIELVYTFMNNSESISNNPTLLDILEIKAKQFKKSVKELCDDAIEMIRSFGNER